MEENSTAAITIVAATPTTPQLRVDDSALHVIFPDYDAAILHLIVDSVGGDLFALAIPTMSQCHTQQQMNNPLIYIMSSYSFVSILELSNHLLALHTPL